MKLMNCSFKDWKGASILRYTKSITKFHHRCFHALPRYYYANQKFNKTPSSFQFFSKVTQQLSKLKKELLVLVDLHETRKELVSFIVQQVEIHQILNYTPSTYHLFTKFYKININFLDSVIQTLFRVLDINFEEGVNDRIQKIYIYFVKFDKQMVCRRSIIEYQMNLNGLDYEKKEELSYQKNQKYKLTNEAVIQVHNEYSVMQQIMLLFIAENCFILDPGFT